MGACPEHVGLVAIAYLCTAALHGTALLAAWSLEGVALAQVARRTRDHVAWLGALGFLLLATTHALLLDAPPTALLTGANSLTAAAVGLAASGVVLVQAGLAQLPDSRSRGSLWVGAAAALLYLGSVAIITVFQLAPGTTADTILELSVRQQGQVVLSASWAVVGLIAMIVGLRRNLEFVRNVAIGLLLMTVAKVFLYDLSTLTAIYRVVSFLALGLLLLASAFAYQRLRPPPLPDMRSVHPSQR